MPQRRRSHAPRASKRRVLLVTHPVDYGNYVFAKNLRRMFEHGGAFDLEHHAFSPEEVNYTQKKLSKLDRFRRTKEARLRDAFAMRKLFAQARRERRVVVYQGISPALFCTPWHQQLETYVVLDWTRKLYEPIRNKTMSPPLLTLLHKAVVRWSVSGVIGVTDAVVRSLLNDYGAPPRKVHKGRMPFDVDHFRPSRSLSEDAVRLLFVGGDFHRKGGDRLLRWYERSGHAANVELTIVTQSDVRVPEGVRLIQNDPKFSPVEAFSQNDLFVLPTRYDAYPQVLGEAACSGLGIVTTTEALGAPEVIDEGENGFIVGSDDAFCDAMDRVVSSPALLRAMKQKSRAKMEAEFTFEACFSAIEDVLFASEKVPA